MNLERLKLNVQNWVPERLKEYIYRRTKSRALFTLYGLAFKEFVVSFPQFFTWKTPVTSIFRALKYMVLALARIFLGKALKQSYSFQGEDRNIEGILKPLITKSGFYVDVGCNEPRFISNSFLFYRRGWRGVCIDANDEVIKKYKKIRPRDKAICALVSDKKEDKQFLKFTNNVLSSTSEINVTRYLKEGQKIIETKLMHSVTLTEILTDNNVPNFFDFLSIDVEEHDFQVLKSLDFEKFHPKLIIIEDESFDPSNPTINPIFSFLTKKDYFLVGSILTNLYFHKL